MITHKFHYKAILGTLGLLCHVPALMAFVSMVIALVFEEYYALVPFAISGIISLVIGQIFFHLFYKPRVLHLWDAMVIAALGWLVCPLLATIPLYLISNTSELLSNTSAQNLSPFISSAFEVFSGFTSTGLSMVQEPQYLPHVLQWWRSLTEWIGGIGLVVFILTLTQPNKAQFELYYAEARSESIGKNIKETSRIIWMLYSLFTGAGILLFFLAGVPLWEAINHSFSGISTGGFTITKDSFSNHTVLVDLIAIFIMILGMMSFSMHYQIFFQARFKSIWSFAGQKILLGFLLVGGSFMLLFNFFDPVKYSSLSVIFQWVSAIATCGYRSENIEAFPVSLKLFMILGMVFGGSAGSTAGGFKLQRLSYLFSGFILRVKSVITERERFLVKKQQSHKDVEPSGFSVPKTEKSERLFAASILFTLWIFTLFIGWFLMMLQLPEQDGISALFEVVSAVSNVGLSCNLIGPDFFFSGKVLYIALMWLGRLEIIPAIFLVFSAFNNPKRKKVKKKQPLKAR